MSSEEGNVVLSDNTSAHQMKAGVFPKPARRQHVLRFSVAVGLEMTGTYCKKLVLEDFLLMWASVGTYPDFGARAHCTPRLCGKHKIASQLLPGPDEQSTPSIQTQELISRARVAIQDV